MSDPKDEMISEELRKNISKVIQDPSNTEELLHVILELQNKAIKNLQKRVKEIERYQEEQRQGKQTK